MTDRFSDAFGNIASYNGNEEWLWEMADKLREVEEGKNFCLGVPPEGWITARPALWMMLVSAFGDWGTSIRFGWIDQTKAAADFIDEATERHAEWRKDGAEDG